jgi:hypothetical protein
LFLGIEETDPIIKIGIAAAVFLIVVFTGSVKYLQYKEKRRLELK